MGDGYVFISYAHADIGFVQRLVNYLTARGVPVWWDAEIPNGERWRNLLEAKLAGAAAVVLVESRAAQDSGWVGTEVQYAQKLNKPVLILLIEGEVRQGLHDRQYEPGFGGAMPGERFLDRGRRLLAQATPVQPRPILPAEAWEYPGPPKNMVPRPIEVDGIVAALTRKEASGTVGLTGIQGGGGLGKTIVAQMAASRDDVKAAFPGGLLWVNLGQDRRGSSLAASIGELCLRVGGEHPGPMGPDEAGKVLVGLLADRPATLVILDDLWWADQLKPFQQGDLGRARLLVTTRNGALLDDSGATISVDILDEKLARLVLLRDVPPLPEEAVRRLLKTTGGWALVVNTTNAQLRHAIRQGSDPAGYSAFLARSLEAEGLVGLDARDPEFFAAMMAPSLAMIPELGRRRAVELAVFAEDTDIELDLVALLWGRTGSLSRPQSRHLISELKDLNLITELRPETGVARLHDLVRGYLAAQAGEDRVRATHGALLDAVADHHGLDADSATGRAWWQLPSSAGYLRGHLVEHLLGAGRGDQARAVLTDLRWTETRLLSAGGAAALDTDLARLQDPMVAALRRALLREVQWLHEVRPSHSYADVLAARLGTDPALANVVNRFRQTLPVDVVRMRPGWALPDGPDPALRNVLTGHTSTVTAVAVSPDGSWLASASYDGTVRLWDASTGREQAKLTGHSGVKAIAIAPDGTWLVSVGSGTARLWDVKAGTARRLYEGMPEDVTAVAISPDGTWIASACREGALIWDATTGADRAFLCHPYSSGRSDVIGVAIAPDGSWLVTTSWDHTARIWETPSSPPQPRRGRWTFRRQPPPAEPTTRTILSGHKNHVSAAAISPDGTWLATGSGFTGGSGSIDNTVRIWDVATGTERATFTGHDGQITGIAIAPDGTWLASSSWDDTIRIWDITTGDVRAVLTGHTSVVKAVAVAPDGTWLASGGHDGTVRIWAMPTERKRAADTLRHTGGFTQVSIAPDGTWFATSSHDKAVRYWDAVTGQLLVTLSVHEKDVNGVAIAPDGDWAVSIGEDKFILLWDGPSRQWSESAHYLRDQIAGRRYVYMDFTAVAVSPDGTWVATRIDTGNVFLWDVATQRERAELVPADEEYHSPDPTRIGSLAIAPNGTWLATCGNEPNVKVWDADTGTERAALIGHEDIVNSVAIAPDGTWLATASEDHTVRLWDATTATERTTFAGRIDGRTTVAISPTGARLATASEDGTLRLWDAATGDNLATMRVAGWLMSLCWSQDEKAVFAVGQYGPYRFNIHVDRYLGE